MVTFGLSYDVKKGHEKAFEGISIETIKAMDGIDGHVETVLYQDVLRPGSYMIYSNWKTPQAFRAFMASKAFREVQGRSRDLLAGPPKHSMYQKADTMNHERRPVENL